MSQPLSKAHRDAIGAIPTARWKSLSSATRAKLMRPGTDLEILHALGGAPVMSIPVLQAIAAQQQVALDALAVQLAAAREPHRDPATGGSSIDARMQLVEVTGHEVTNSPGLQTLGALVERVVR